MTTIINVKVKNIRPEYSSLEEWMKIPNHEYIGRAGIVFINGKRFPKISSDWANPYKVKNIDKDECLILYEKWLRDKLKKEGTSEFIKLKGKILGCWCKPEKCHGDIIIKILNEIDQLN